ncbi:MAG: hypothetical protein ACK4XK_05640, partial [Casimicrobiaceae bacterium]
MALLALVVALVVLIERFPASFALAWLPEASRPHVQIERASGTLWGGEAELASPWLPARQQISWQCRPAWSLRLVCTLDGALRGELSIDRAGRLEGRGLRANLPIQVSLQGAPRGPLTPEAARRLWAGSKPLSGTLARAYLSARAIGDLRDAEWLRFHPH